MFTGIIQAVADVVSHTNDDHGLDLTIRTPDTWDLHIGQSIATNGVCLTVASIDEPNQTFTVQLIPETLAKTSLGTVIPERVNLERAMSADGLFEGHIVQGHVDTTVTLESISSNEHGVVYSLKYPQEFADYLSPKGSITLDGISLTVAEIDESQSLLSVALIPHTLQNTTISNLQAGDHINVEFDIIAKLVVRKMRPELGR